MTPSDGSRRILASLPPLVLAGAIVCLLALGAGAARPATADAWAWKDSCFLSAYNQTPQQSYVRPVLYTPLPPLPTASLALYAALAVTGVPTSGASTFINTGYPVPTYGCHAMMQFLNPGANENCTYNAPTTGANHFNCNGAASVKITKDDDDIWGEVTFHGTLLEPSAPVDDTDGDGDSDAAFPPGLNPANQPAALRPSELPGDQWVDSRTIGGLGRAGELMTAGDVTDACAAGEDGPVPTAVRSSLLTRDGGDDGVGAVSERHASADEAQAAADEVLSDASIRCLSQLLASGDDRTDVATDDAPSRGADADGVRLTLTRGTRTDVLEVLAWADGRDARVLMLASDGGPLPNGVASAALRRVG